MKSVRLIATEKIPGNSPKNICLPSEQFWSLVTLNLEGAEHVCKSE